MKTFCIVLSLVFAVFLWMACADNQNCGAGRGAQTHGLTFMNITTTEIEDEAGFVQVFAYSVNQTEIILEAKNDSVYRRKTVQGIGGTQTYNETAAFGTGNSQNTISQDDPVTESDSDPNYYKVRSFGIIVSSRDPVHVIGVKSDKGTTDAYAALPVVTTSKEFVIAGWPKIADRDFLASILVVAVEDETCVEIYKVFEDATSTQMVSLAAGSGTLQYYDVLRYFAYEEIGRNGRGIPGNEEDVTGYFVNASKPVAVYFGHECAWVPTTDVLFCDYMVEQIPPRDQLGRRFVLPIIKGRNSAAGYVFRVVPAEFGPTKITYNGNTQTKYMGTFAEFETNNANEPVYVECDKDCIVMLYNKGYLQTALDVPTDPFMMLVAPDNRWTAGTGFATASFCLEKTATVNFNNFMTIVTFDAYKNNIQFDGTPVMQADVLQPGTWRSYTFGGIQYAVLSMSVPHGFHTVDLAPGTFGSFVVYVYGHSNFEDSSSGYGFCANYNITGEGLCENYEKAVEKDPGTGGLEPDASCTGEAWLTGQIISSNLGQYVPVPFTLRASIDPGASLTPVCLAQYNDQLMQLLQDFSRKINEWICSTKNCTFLNGVGVAIDYSTLNINWIGSGGVYTAVEIQVTMIASLDATAENFAKCLAEIRNYMYYFIHWPPHYTPDLLHQTIDGCPDIRFAKPQFEIIQNECPAIPI